ncbi:hypothetical protein A3A70_00275 [candidate division WWE3 bacterium RIFCSPLOWO2_01_FULL_42_11]|uniref:Glycosyl transferase family 1 domain-containing protein n=1 Tax=candidate division WWE3 bacterium RIFCSPLOWO2_01_FULL_42_11 TaxID=1802627 RepID=A0A1F4VLM7_UNCKA|nr:MAG: hypothetical protein A3A70_00275 [candidate division WWE3 bacterium RIFCSPLOWO2_01_FULL_42_11]
MKVLIAIRHDAYDTYGGDVLHAEKVSRGLKDLGVKVTLTIDSQPNLEGVDILHVFNLDWIIDSSQQVKTGIDAGIPVVLTPIHHSFVELDAYEAQTEFGFNGIVSKIFPHHAQREILKNIYRSVIQMDTKKWAGTLKQLFVGINHEYLDTLEKATIILPNTELELKALEVDFGFIGNSEIVPAGVDPSFSKGDKSWFSKTYPEISKDLGEKFILSVGRIELRKNQLRLLHAARLADLPILLVGSFNPHHKSYANAIRHELELNPRAHHIEKIEHINLPSVYKAAGIHALVSFAETTGLVSLEGSLADCVIVSSSWGFGREYLGNQAIYIEPDDVESIKAGLLKAWESRPSKELKEKVLEKYTWENVCQKTLTVYEDLLKG